MDRFTRGREIGLQPSKSHRMMALQLKAITQDLTNAVVAENVPLARALLTEVVHMTHTGTERPHKDDLAQQRKYAGQYAPQRVAHALAEIREFLQAGNNARFASEAAIDAAMTVPEFDGSEDDVDSQWPFKRDEGRNAEDAIIHDNLDEEDPPSDGAEPPLQRRRVGE